MATNILPHYNTPYLFDKVIEDVAQSMKANLPWLDIAYGRCERLIKTIDGRRYYTPNVYLGRGEYDSLLPDDRRGCYSFFVMSEPQQVKQQVQTEVRIKSPFSLIVWADMRRVDSVMNLPDERNTEYLKEAILSVLNTTRTRRGSFNVISIYERAENVFQGFTLDEVDNQFLMAPFAGFRFTGEMIVTNDCNM